MNQEEIDAKIAALNQTEYDYDQASTPEQEKAADSRFSACWDWLIENEVPFYRTRKSGSIVMERNLYESL